MELTNILKELWRLRWWVMLGFIISGVAGVASTNRIQLSPFEIQRKSFEYGVASTQVLVESKALPIVDVDSFRLPLAGQASVFAQLMSSEPVLTRVAATIGVAAGSIVAEQPLLPQGEGRTAEERANDVAAESLAYRLRFATQKDLPIITLFAQGPTPQQAARLADGAVTAFRQYIEERQDQQSVPESRRVAVRRLGPAQAGLVNAGTGRAMAVLAFGGAFTAWCVLVLLASNVARNWHRVDGALAPLEGQRPS